MDTEDRIVDFPTMEAYTIPGLLRVRAGQHGERVFMRRKHLGIWQSHSFLDVYERVKNICLGLVDLGLQEGETVAIVGENELETFWAEYAVLCARGKVVCVYPDATPQELKHVLDDAEVVMVIAEDQEQVDKTFEAEPNQGQLRHIIYWDPKGMWSYRDPLLRGLSKVEESGKKIAQENPVLFDQKIDSVQRTDIAILSYTSGTSGKPKGVIMDHNFLMDNAMRLFANLPFKKFTRYLSYISPAWGTEQYFGVSLGLLVPFEISFPEKPETILSNIRELGAELLLFGPRQWESLASDVRSHMMDAGPVRRAFYNLGLKVGYKVRGNSEGKTAGLFWNMAAPFAEQFVLKPLRDNLGLRHCYLPISGGSAMAPDVFRFFHAMGVRLRNAYGASELGMFTAHTGNFSLETVGVWLKSHPDLGPPLEWRITNEGELQVKGGAGFLGYYNKPDSTADALDEGWFKTGDAVRMRDDGQLIYLDRVSDLRELSNGYKFPPQFIETRLRFSPYIKDAIILGDRGKPYVSALININIENTGKWAEKNGIDYSTFSDLSQNENIRDLIGREISQVNQMLDEGSMIKFFINLPKDLDPDEEELTRTRKLRRGFLEDKYSEMIRNIYDSVMEFKVEIPVKYQDGRTGVIKANVFVNHVSVTHLKGR